MKSTEKIRTSKGISIPAHSDAQISKAITALKTDLKGGVSLVVGSLIAKGTKDPYATAAKLLGHGMNANQVNHIVAGTTAGDVRKFREKHALITAKKCKGGGKGGKKIEMAQTHPTD